MKPYIFTFLLLYLLSTFLYSQTRNSTIETGVSETLAMHRKTVLSNVHYKLWFEIPVERSSTINARETISFDLVKDFVPLLIDFKENKNNIRKIFVNRREIKPVIQNEHVVIEQKYLKAGSNAVDIDFIAGELSLNRNDNYLYTLLVPDRSRTVFPCFDQPNIKARFKLSLTTPKEWEVITNAALHEEIVTGNLKTRHFKESDLFSTYLFSFTAGKFNVQTKIMDQWPMQFYYRETDPNKIRLSLDSVFEWHVRAIRFLEEYTQIKFPFQKFDFVAIPDFQYGGMEHVGAINYRASFLFLDSGATKDQHDVRKSFIAHETAHMWFGDLVTMQWFNDVWMKEVFASFMADKITVEKNAKNSYALKFLLTHFPRAYAIDRTAGANPIRQPLPNLVEAGTLYGSIIYHKAPVMMRQLERLIGEDSFREGVRQYLKKYSFGNATWSDLIYMLDARTSANLQAWDKGWVNTAGRPVISYHMKQHDDSITKFVISQQGEQNSDYLLPQLFEIALIYEDSIEEITVNQQEQHVELKMLKGKPVPRHILFNSSGQGYGLFPLDTSSSMSIMKIISKLKSPVMRASAYINLYENMLCGHVKPVELLNTLLQIINQREEPEELILNLIARYIVDIYWKILPARIRNNIVTYVENMFWDAMQKETVDTKKKTLFAAYQSVATTDNSLQKLYQIWKGQQPPEGVYLSEEEYISLALMLAVKGYPDPNALSDQLLRTANADRKQRLEFLIPAVSENKTIRDQFFASLKDLKTRKKEAWVADALFYLHHPLHQSQSIKYLNESLEMLQEIQKTGDIFFPAAWLAGTLGFYQSTEAADIVKAFLKRNPNYNHQLRAKILQAADPLFRAERLMMIND